MARIRQGDWRQTFTFEVGLRSFILVYILPRDINTDLLHYFIGGFELFKFFCLLFVFYLTAQHKGYVIRQNIWLFIVSFSDGGVNVAQLHL